jgi:hypothetical protein
MQTRLYFGSFKEGSLKDISVNELIEKRKTYESQLELAQAAQNEIETIANRSNEITVDKYKYQSIPGLAQESRENYKKIKCFLYLINLITVYYIATRLMNFLQKFNKATSKLLKVCEMIKSNLNVENLEPDNLNKILLDVGILKIILEKFFEILNELENCQRNIYRDSDMNIHEDFQTSEQEMNIFLNNIQEEDILINFRNNYNEIDKEMKIIDDLSDSSSSSSSIENSETPVANKMSVKRFLVAENEQELDTSQKLTTTLFTSAKRKAPFSFVKIFNSHYSPKKK